jgi:putative oxidoreductase
MAIFEASRTLWTSRVLSVFRIVAGLVLVSNGTMKVFGYPPGPQPLPPFVPMSLLGVAGMLEMVGGTAIVLGLFTRPVALVLAGEMAVAYFRTHFPVSPFPTANQGTPALLYCFLFLYLTFAGAGVWSLDALILRRRWSERRAPLPVPMPELRPRPVHPRPTLHRGPTLHRAGR